MNIFYKWTRGFWCAVIMLALLTFGAAPVPAAERNGEGGGFDAFTDLLGPAGWIASGKSVGRGDIARMYQGPSAFRSDRGDAVMATYSQPFGNIDGFDLGSIDVTTDRLPWGNVGVSFSQLRAAGIREASTIGLTGNFFDAHMDAARITFAPRHNFNKGRFGYGVAAGYYNISIRERSKSRFGLDLGADYTVDSARIILNVRNLSTERNDADGLPITGELRGEWSPYSSLHLGGALSIRENGEGDFQLGAQYDIYNLISIMGGYVGSSSQWTAGAKVYSGGLSLQYGLAAHRELDFSHTVSLGVEF